MASLVREKSPQTDPLPSRIATLVHAYFDGLPKRSKPIIRDDGTAEWIPMTGIVLVKAENTPDESLSCITVTSGAKCLPASQIPTCNGLVLHDCHAEILAMRAFNYWLLSECHSAAAAESSLSQVEGNRKDTGISASPYIQRRQKPNPESEACMPPFELCPDVSIYMYCTCAPCGDASMELVMAAQDDPTPWTLPDPTASSQSESDSNPPAQTPSSSENTFLKGRGHFSQLGIVRRKPARADAESTKSKSCSDKIALRQVTSLLNHQASLLVAITENAYIKGLVMPEEEITRVGCERCFGKDGRMKDLGGKSWPIAADDDNEASRKDQEGNGRQDQYEFRPFEVLSIPNSQLKALWPFRKPKTSDPVEETQTKKSKPGTISAVWVRAPTTESKDLRGPPSTIADNGSKNLPVLRGSKTGLFESIIGGVKQGNKASAPGLRGASALSRARMWEYLRKIAHGDSAHGQSPLETLTYRKFKEQQSSNSTQARKQAMQAAKEVLGGWLPNSGDEDWGWNPDSLLVDSKGTPIGEAPKKRKR
ncbi:adenosine deaminase/editase [Aspergillus unguis]